MNKIEEYGLTEGQVKKLLGDKYKEFNEWMTGQTVAFIHEKNIIYYHDLARWLRI